MLTGNFIRCFENVSFASKPLLISEVATFNILSNLAFYLDLVLHQKTQE
jgi:hypothetical protein